MLTLVFICGVDCARTTDDTLEIDTCLLIDIVERLLGTNDSSANALGALIVSVAFGWILDLVDSRRLTFDDGRASVLSIGACRSGQDVRVQGARLRVRSLGGRGRI